MIGKRRFLNVMLRLEGVNRVLSLNINTGECGGGGGERELYRDLIHDTGHRASSGTGNRSTLTPDGEKTLGNLTCILRLLFMKTISPHCKVVRGSNLESF
jgi:hypothetical protein